MAEAKIHIRQVRGDDAFLKRLLEVREDEMGPLYPQSGLWRQADANFANLWFLASHDGVAAGCVSLSRLTDGYEVRRLFVVSERRHREIASALLIRAEKAARALNARVLRLESGRKLAAAHRLYTAQGYVPGEAFGRHSANGDSLFFFKLL